MILRQVLQYKKDIWLLGGFLDFYTSEMITSSENVSYTESKNVCITSVCSELTELWLPPSCRVAQKAGKDALFHYVSLKFIRM